MVMRMFSRTRLTKQPSSVITDDDGGGSVSSPSTPKRKITSGFNSPFGRKKEGIATSEMSIDTSGGTSAAANQLAEASAFPPPRPTGGRTEQMVEVRGASRDGPMKVSDTIALFVSTWNMVGCTVLPTRDVLANWLPTDYDLYAIAIQNCRSTKQLQEKILDYLGEDEFKTFKYILLGQSSLLLFARATFYSTGVLAQTRLNFLLKFEVKTKSLVGGMTGRGCILMQMIFHNTTIAFVALNLDDDVDGFDRRTADLEFCLKSTGIIQSDTNEIGTPVLSSVQHVFLFGNFGVKQLEKCQGASKSTWKGKWAQSMLYCKEFEDMSKANAALDAFEELEVRYPPTSRRKATQGATPTRPGGEPFAPLSSPREGRSQRKSDLASTLQGPRKSNLKSMDSSESSNTVATGATAPTANNNNGAPHSTIERRLSGSFVSMFEKDFDVSNLFDPKLIKKEGEPSYEDRVFFKSQDAFRHLMELGKTGSAEAVRLGTHVPVYSTFLLCGIDGALLKRWQVITGNIPPEHATRTDQRMVTGVVEDFLSQLNEKTLSDIAEAEHREKLRQQYLAEMRRCDRCTEPLSLEGGDVELGDKAAFHRHCFTCEDCGKDLLGEKLMLADGKWLCWDSFNRMYQSACPVCKLNITGERVRVGKEMVSYHLPCFNCTLCGEKLVENGKIKEFLDMDGKPYCLADFEKVKDKCCMACKMHIDEEDRVNAGSRFHKKCYHCTVCGIDMNKTNLRIVVRDYKVFCEIDHLKDLLAQEKKKKYLQEREEDAKLAKEEEEADKRKREEMLARRISMIPAGFDISNFDLPEDEDIAEEDDDE